MLQRTKSRPRVSQVLEPNPHTPPQKKKQQQTPKTSQPIQKGPEAPQMPESFSISKLPSPRLPQHIAVPIASRADDGRCLRVFRICDETAPSLSVRVQGLGLKGRWRTSEQRSFACPWGTRASGNPLVSGRAKISNLALHRSTDILRRTHKLPWRTGFCIVVKSYIM